MPSKRRTTPSLPPAAANCKKLLKKGRLRQLFELSQLSIEDYDLVKKTILLRRSQVELNVYFQKKTSVDLYLRGKRLGWVFYGNRDPERFKLENFEKKTLKLKNDTNGTRMSIDYWQESESDYGCKLNSMEEVLKFIEYIADLFNVKNKDLTIERECEKTVDLEAIQSIEVLKNCKKATLCAQTVSHDEMRRVLSGWSNSLEAMIVKCHPEPNFRFNRIISVPRLLIYGGTWFKGPMLLKLDCKRVGLDTWCLSNEDINMFLRHWLNSSNKKLKSLIVEKKFKNSENFDCYEDTWRSQEALEEHSFDMDKITDGLSEYRINEPVVDVEKRTFCRQTDQSRVQVLVFDLSHYIPQPSFSVEFTFHYD